MAARRDRTLVLQGVKRSWWRFRDPPHLFIRGRAPGLKRVPGREPGLHLERVPSLERGPQLGGYGEGDAELP